GQIAPRPRHTSRDPRPGRSQAASIFGVSGQTHFTFEMLDFNSFPNGWWRSFIFVGDKRYPLVCVIGVAQDRGPRQALRLAGWRYSCLCPSVLLENASAGGSASAHGANTSRSGDPVLVIHEGSHRFFVALRVPLQSVVCSPPSTNDCYASLLHCRRIARREPGGLPFRTPGGGEDRSDLSGSRTVATAAGFWPRRPYEDRTG